MSSSESTTVDVLVARLSTHPEEFFVAEAVITQDGARIFAGTKWRRITTMLMTSVTPEGNMWLEMFSDEEKQRFKTAMLEALRGVIDTQMMKVLTGGDPVELDPEEKARQMGVSQGQYNNALSALGLNTIGYGLAAQNSASDEYVKARFEQARKTIPPSPPLSLLDKAKRLFP